MGELVPLVALATFARRLARKRANCLAWTARKSSSRVSVRPGVYWGVAVVASVAGVPATGSAFTALPTVAVVAMVAFVVAVAVPLVVVGSAAVITDAVTPSSAVLAAVLVASSDEVEGLVELVRRAGGWFKIAVSGLAMVASQAFTGGPVDALNGFVLLLLVLVGKSIALVCA